MEWCRRSGGEEGEESVLQVGTTEQVVVGGKLLTEGEELTEEETLVYVEVSEREGISGSLEKVAGGGSGAAYADAAGGVVYRGCGVIVFF